MSKQVRIYGCGGAGIKLANKFDRNANFEHCADVQVAYVDSSAANLKALDSSPSVEDNAYLFPNCDGAGHKRDQNAEVIMANIAQVIEKFPAASPLNIIVGSLSGGTGSVVMPVMANEFLKDNIPFIVIGIVSNESLIAADNTIKTIRTFDNFARRNESPVVASFHNNGTNLHNGTVDKEITDVISSLCILASGAHPDLDSEDLRNWIQFSRVCDVEPQLAALDVVHDLKELTPDSYPVSVASLTKEGGSDVGTLGAEYYSESTTSDPAIPEMHFIINVNDPTEILKQMDDAKQVLKKRANSRPKTKPLGGGNADDCMEF